MRRNLVSVAPSGGLLDTRRDARSIVTGSGTSTPLNPLTLPGLQLWLDASQQVGADASAVTTFPDRSGNGRDLAQATAGNKPTLRTSGLGAGKKSIRFLTDDWLETAASHILAAPSSHHLFIVAHSSVDTVGATVFEHRIAPPGATIIAVNEHTSTTINASRPDSATAATSRTLNTNWLTLGTARVIRQEYFGLHATHKLFLEGVDTNAVNGVSTADPGTGASSAGKFSLGNRNGGGGTFFNGDIGEVLLYSAALSAPNVALVEAYLIAKWL